MTILVNEQHISDELRAFVDNVILEAGEAFVPRDRHHHRQRHRRLHRAGAGAGAAGLGELPGPLEPPQAPAGGGHRFRRQCGLRPRSWRCRALHQAVPAARRHHHRVPRAFALPRRLGADPAQPAVPLRAGAALPAGPRAAGVHRPPPAGSGFHPRAHRREPLHPGDPGSQRRLHRGASRACAPPPNSSCCWRRAHSCSCSPKPSAAPVPTGRAC